MVKKLSFFCACLLAAIAPSVRATSPAEYRAFLNGTHRSLTGQFIIHDAPAMDNYPLRVEIPTNFIRLDPTLLSVSCERIKKSLLNILGTRDQWKSQIIINLHHFHDANEPLVVAPELFDHSWIYRLELPDHLDRPKLISAMVEVLLLEMANRNYTRSTQIPAWLAQGMSREVQFSGHTQLILEPPQKSAGGLFISQHNSSGERVNPLTTAHADLNALPPLTLAQLSWPADGQLQGEAGELYRSSAQYLVHELLLLPDGHAALFNFIQALPSHLNWQISFFKAFHTDFANQLAADKWWALRLVQFTGRDLTQTWSSDESWRKLDEIIRPVVDVRTRVNELPLRTQITLQAIIRDWDRIRQIRLLQEKSQQLLILRLRVSPELAYLVDDYRRVVEYYVKKRDNLAVVPIGRPGLGSHLDSLAYDTILELNALDARRQALQPKPQVHQAPNNNISANN